MSARRLLQQHHHHHHHHRDPEIASRNDNPDEWQDRRETVGLSWSAATRPLTHCLLLANGGKAGWQGPSS